MSVSNESIVSPNQPPVAPAQAYADTWATRLEQATAEAEEYFAEGMALLEDVGSRAPVTTGEPKAPPTPAGQQEAKGPEGTPSQQPAAQSPTAQDTAGTPATPETTPTDAVQANNQKRAVSQQAILQRQVEEYQARLAALQQENQKLLTDNRVLFGQHEQVRNMARQQGAVRYEDVDQAITDAALREHQRQQEENAVIQQQANSRQQQGAAWQAAVGERVTAATTAREQTIAKILEAAIETDQKVTYDQAAAFVKTGYEDPAVLADIQLWQSDQVPNALANARIAQAYARIYESTKAKLVQQAMQLLQNGSNGVPQYDRSMAYGAGTNSLPANYSSMTYEQRLRHDLNAANDQFEADMRRVLG